jgi:hypothetical protein
VTLSSEPVHELWEIIRNNKEGMAENLTNQGNKINTQIKES